MEFVYILTIFFSGLTAIAFILDEPEKDSSDSTGKLGAKI